MPWSAPVRLVVLVFWNLCQIVLTHQDAPLRGPPIVETNINLLDSYLPASMQIIAHLTDLMKYDLRPDTQPSKPTSTTFRPTRPHSPGLYAPDKPLGPETFFSKGTTYDEYVHMLQNPDGHSYFDKYKNPFEEDEEIEAELMPRINHRARSGDVEEDPTSRYNPRARSGVTDEDVPSTTLRMDVPTEETPKEDPQETIPDGIDALIGHNTFEVFKLANKLEEDTIEDDVERARSFETRYDDDVKLRQKRVPPTKAYVSLLSLYDHLNKESKKMGLSKYQGYTKKVLENLIETSGGTSSNQLRFVLSKIIEKRDVKQENVLMKIKSLVKDLEQDDSYINNALRYIPPLQFSP